MKFLVAWIIAAGCITSPLLAQAATKSLAMAELRDKIRGGWAGKMAGVAFGGPTEFKHMGKIVPVDALPKWDSAMVKDALEQDDLYVQMTYAEVLDAKGLAATTADFAEMLKRSEYPLWHTSLAARRNLRRGIPVMDCATPAYSTHGQDISFQIIADFIGMSCPGMPKAAAELSDRVSRVAAWGDGECAGRFVAGLYAAAFFESDAEKLIEASLRGLPQDSDYVHAIGDVLQLHRDHPDDWEAAWRAFNAKWDNHDACPIGALNIFDIDAKLNGGYLCIGLLYGGDDFKKTIVTATRCGQDSDCNPCTAGGVWGAAHGFAKIPAKFTDGLEAIGDRKFVFTQSTYHSAIENTMHRAEMVTKANGGSVDADALHIVRQTVEPTPVRTFKAPGRPIERVWCTDARWSYTGNWNSYNNRDSNGNEKWSRDKGDEAKITFHGTGAIVCGSYLARGGQADVYLDGKFDRTVDVYPDAVRRIAAEDVWHKFDLPDADHEIRVVVRGKNYGDSKGAEVHIHSLVVYHQEP